METFVIETVEGSNAVLLKGVEVIKAQGTHDPQAPRQ
jgi:hypothetical protein